METKVATAAATPDPNFGDRPIPQRPVRSGARPTTAQQDPDLADLRLVIEEDRATNSYVYKTVDRRTGKVVQQLPREQVLQLREQLDYEAGAVVRARA